ncbi:MAG: hypothetical protein COA79_22940, partial [Planctomycetota bacterium]
RQIKVYGDTNNPGVTTYNANGDIATFEVKRWDPDLETYGPTRSIETYTYTGTELTGKTVSNFDSSKVTTESWSYDSLERLDVYTDMTGIQTKYEYDSLDRVVKVISDFGNRNIESVTQYNLTGQATGTVFAGLTSGNTFDSIGRVKTSVQDPNEIYFVSMTYDYDEQDRQVKVTDHRGNEMTYEYDEYGNQEKMTGFRGIVTTSEYDDINQLVKQTYDEGVGKRNLITTYTYDNMGRQISVTQNEGKSYEITTTSVYNDKGQLESTNFDATGKDITTTYEYDFFGQLITTTVHDDVSEIANDKITRSTYNEYGELETSTDINGIITKYDYDYLGRQIKTTFDPESLNPGGLDVSTETIYKTNGLVDKTINARGFETTIQYDTLNRQIGTTFDPGSAPAANLSTSQVYNDKNQVVSAFSQTGIETTFEYDSFPRRVETIVDPTGDNRITTLTFDILNDLTNVNDPAGNNTGRTYNGFGDLETVTNAKGHVTSFTYTEYGEQETVTDNDSKVTKTIYDDRGLVDNQTQDFGGLGLITSFVYDIYGRVLETTDPEGKKVGTTYNVFDQVLTTTDDVDGLAVVTTNKYYDKTLQLETITDDANNVTSYFYDIYQRLETETYADTKSKVYTYNKYSQRETVDDQRGNKTTFNYDSFGRLEKTKITNLDPFDGAHEMNYTYDSEFRLETADSIGGKTTSLITRHYDDFNRLTSEDQTIGGVLKTVSKTFDAVGRLDEVTYPSGRGLTYQYDSTHQVTSIFDTVTPANEYVGYTYNNRNLVATKTLGNGLKLTKGYDAAYRTTSQEWTNAGSTIIAGFDYKYDNVGNRKVEIALHAPAQATKSAVYNYDTTYKVTGYKQGALNVAEDDVPTALFYQDWTQDTLGNWSSFDNDGTVDNRSHDSMNQITSTGFTHDNTGNMTSDGSNDYEFDAMNRLIKATVGSTVTEYSYDAMGRRIQKDVGGVVTNFVHMGVRVIEEQDGLGVLVKDFVYGSRFVDEVVTMGVGGNDYYYLVDYRYSVIALSDSSGNIVERYEYTPFGERTVTDNTYIIITSGFIGNDYGFTGRRHDVETGIMYFRARYYSGKLGRFLSRDPKQFIDGMSLHRGYFGVNFADPFGLETYFHKTTAGKAAQIIRGNFDPKKGKQGLIWLASHHQDVNPKGCDIKLTVSTDVPKATYTMTKDDVNKFFNEAEKELKKKFANPERGHIDGLKWSKIRVFLSKLKHEVIRVNVNPSGSRHSLVLKSNKGLRVIGWSALKPGPAGIRAVEKVKSLLRMSSSSPAKDQAIAKKKLGKNASFMKWGGRSIVVLGVAASGYTVYTAEDHTKALVKEIGRWAAAATYARMGAITGSTAALVAGQAGPQALAPEEVITVPTLAFIGAVFGGAYGFIKGGQVTEKVYDLIFTKGVSVGGEK